MASKPVPNVDLLDRTLAEVRKAARRKRGLTWDQTAYREERECGTAMCFAGWALHLDGAEWADGRDPQAHEWDVLPRRGERPNGGYGFATTPVVSAHVAARRRLGLSEQEAENLFEGGNTLRDLSRIVREIKQRASS